jgi:hypothetical protein
MSDPGTLRAEAAAATATARRCEELAAEIERGRLASSTRLEEVRARHRPEVWQSSAAESSRAMLERYIAPGLWVMGEHLATTAGLLRERAGDLIARSRSLVASATELESDPARHESILLP